jgi:hypothetical protein
MTETQPPRRIGRNILAVLVGMVVAVALTLATDEMLHRIGVFPPWGASMVGYEGALLLATVYRTVYGVLSSYITARLAPSRPWGPAFGPHWYPLALVVLALPTAWVGGKLGVNQLSMGAAQ